MDARLTKIDSSEVMRYLGVRGAPAPELLARVDARPHGVGVAAAGATREEAGRVRLRRTGGERNAQGVMHDAQ